VPGTPGQKGDKGDKGDPGAKGDKGDADSQGQQGQAGPPGQDAVLPPESDPTLSTDYGTTITNGAAYQTAFGAQIGMTASQPGATAVGCRSGVGGQYAIAMGYGSYGGGGESL